MKTTRLLICAVSLAAAFAAADAQGQVFDVKFLNHSPFGAVTGTVDDGSFEQAWPSGAMNFQTPDGEGGLIDFQAFCIEPTQAIGYGEELTYEVQDPVSLAGFDTISRLIGGYQASGQTDLDAAAVHWAIWEVTSEVLPLQDLTFGSVRITDLASGTNQATADLANAYLANVSSYTPASNLVVLRNEHRQDVIAFSAIPEPGSALLVVFSGMLLLRRRR